MADTKEYKELFNQSGVPKQLIIYFPNLSVTLRNEDIVSESMEISESICSGTELRFGSCEASVFKLRIIGNVIPLIGETFTVSIYAGDIAEPLALGTYKVASDKPTADRKYRDIVAYDAMYEIINAEAAAWYNGILPNKDSTTTLRAFRDSFMEHFGIEQEETTLPNDEIVVGRTIEPESISGKDVLSAICELNGCFAHIGRNGKMQYIFLPEIVVGLYPMDTLYPSEDLFPREASGTESIPQQIYISCQYEDYTTKKIGKLQIRQEENDVGCIIGEGENCYIVEGNFLVYGKSATELEAIGQKLFDVISVVWYRPATIKAIGNPCLEVGTGIRVCTQYEIVETYILERTLKGIQALSDSYEAQGVEAYSENVNDVRKSIVELKGKMNILTRTAEETRSQLIDLENDLSSEISQTSEQISAEVRRAQSAEASLSIRADQIATSVSNLDSNLSSKITQNADSITAEVKRAQEMEASLIIRDEEIALSVKQLETDAFAAIEIFADEISLRTTQGQVESMISVALSDITISADQIYLMGNTTINDVLSVDTSGNVKIDGAYSSLKLTSSGLNIFTSESAVASTNITGSEITMFSAVLSQTFTVARVGFGTLTIGNSLADIVCASLNGGVPITSANIHEYI